LDQEFLGLLDCQAGRAFPWGRGSGANRRSAAIADRPNLPSDPSPVHGPAAPPIVARVDAPQTRSYPHAGVDTMTAKEHEPGDAGTVTASEFSFLALGLVLGVVTGAALVEVIRARPASSRAVRLVVTPDSVPRRRAATLSDDAFTQAGAEPARGGPADRRSIDSEAPDGTPERRTTVRIEPPAPGIAAAAGSASLAGAGSPVGPGVASASTGIPVGPGSDAPVPGRIMEPALPLMQPPGRGTGPRDALVGIPISGGADPVLGALRGPAVLAPIGTEGRNGTGVALVAGVAVGGAMAAARPATAPPAVRRPTAVGVLDRPAPAGASAAAVREPKEAGTAAGSAASAASAASDVAGTPAATGPCADERRIADERCEVATRARVQADTAADTLRSAQRSYDSHESAANAAALLADPRTVQAAKEAAQGGFRAAVGGADTQEALEAAARDWLTEINRINGEAREAASTVTRERAAAKEVGLRMERLALEADAARIAAANADSACLAARAAVADCDERVAEDPAAVLVPSVPPPSDRPRLDEDETLGIALEAGAEPRIFRLLRGDRVAMTTLVASLAGDDAESRRSWQLLITRLLEAVIANAIEGGALEFPDDHSFWGLFTRIERRDIAEALASLGYRFDGLGGWTDGRQPSQRDLSLALGYAGLDPMRIRHWPNEAGIVALYADTTVAADEYLAGVAGDLTLAEMVTMLGRRADGLAEVWNVWGRIRPLLLEEG
jgi:hypothetical protein